MGWACVATTQIFETLFQQVYSDFQLHSVPRCIFCCANGKEQNKKKKKETLLWK